ncbi:MAG: phosphoprotein [Tomato betanucleorhabdovirus 1]|uniref:Phosphoprotein n=1 Tax=Tomato betanucleorhabdovirus 1 TaxID=2950850 RepID=A0AAE9SHY4_9RHAB|nr:MAG: phosphoprotein [Tomato betanucleorhabdovirus 1]
MSSGNHIHPRYANLPSTATTSEVMASKYAAEVSKLGSEEEKEFILGEMEGWAAHFREEGLSVADKHLAVLGEVSMIMHKAGKSDMVGKLAVTVADALKSAISEGRLAAVSVEKLDLIADNFLRGIDSLKKATDAIVAATPKKMIKASKKTKGGPVVIQKGADTAHGTEDHKANMAEASDLDNGMQEGNKIPEPMITDTKPEVYPKEDVQVMDSHQEEQLRAKVRLHYSDTEFDSFNDSKKMALVYYYIETILGVSRTLIAQDSNLRQMLFDIVDKRRVIRICNLAKEGAVTAADVADSIEEAQDAVACCGSLYGKYTSEIVTNGQTPVLVIIELPK